MSVSANNDAERLFSMAFGDDWLRTGMAKRTRKELEDVQKLASDHVGSALMQIEALSRTMGAGNVEDFDARRMGWSINTIAENAGILDELEATAGCLLDPEYRKAFGLPSLQD